MYKYCAKCGAEVEQTSAFCFACGAHISKENPALDKPPIILQLQPVPEPEAPAESVPVPDEPPEQPKKRKLRKPLLIAILAAAVIVMAIIAWQVLDAGYETALNTYAAVCNGDLDKIQQMAPAEYWETQAKNNDTTVDEILKQRREALGEKYADIEQIYGEGAHFSAKCVHAEPVDTEELVKIQEYMEEEYGTRPNAVKEAVALEIYMRWDGDIRDSSYMIEYYAVRIGYQWYLGYCYPGKDGMCFTFMTS